MMFNRFVTEKSVKLAARELAGKKSDADIIAELQRMQETEEAKDDSMIEKTETSNQFLRHYLRISNFCKKLVHGKYQNYFNTVMVTTILIAGIAVGVALDYDAATYPQLKPVYDGLDNAIFAVFLFEFIIKIVAEGKSPQMYVLNPEHAAWNCFDVLILIICAPGMSEAVSGGSYSHGKSAANSGKVVRILRLFRLVRMTKIVRQIPALQVIFSGLISGLKSIAFILVLLLLVFYIWGVLGVALFRQNDPFFFRSVPIAMLSLFHFVTFDNWGATMFIGVFGCKRYNGGLYFSRDDPGMTEETWETIPTMLRCDHPTSHNKIAVIYWLSFILIAALVILSLFVGVITMSMQETLVEMRMEAEELNRRKRLTKQLKEMNAMREEKLHLDGKGSFSMKGTALVSLKIPGAIEVDDPEESMKSAPKNNETSNETASNQSDFKRSFNSLKLDVLTKSSKFGAANRGDKLSPSWSDDPLNALKFTFINIVAWITKRGSDSTISFKDMLRQQELHEMKALLMQAWHGTYTAEVYHKGLDSEQSLPMRLIRNGAVRARALLENEYFNHLLTFVIVMVGILVGLETDYKSNSTRYGRTQADIRSADITFYVLEEIIYAIFVVELFLRLLADEFELSEFFKSSWNTLDLVIVTISTPWPGWTNQKFTLLIRLVRLLRIMRTKSLPQLAVIVNALIIGLASIGYVGLVILMTYYIFAVAGVIFFKDNDPFHFGYVGTALFTLLDVATFDSWGDIMYRNMYGCSVYPGGFVSNGPIAAGCDNPDKAPAWMQFVAVVYFVTFCVLGSFVMLTLFIGVVTTSMEEAATLQKLELALENRIRDLCKEKEIDKKQLNIYRRVFSMLDLDGGGSIDVLELEIGMSCLDIFPSKEEMQVWVKEVDINFDGAIDVVEFITFMVNMRKRNSEERFRKNLKKLRAATTAITIGRKLKAAKAPSLRSLRTNSSNALVDRGAVTSAVIAIDPPSLADNETANEQATAVKSRENDQAAAESESSSIKGAFKLSLPLSISIPKILQGASFSSSLSFASTPASNARDKASNLSQSSAKSSRTNRSRNEEFWREREEKKKKNKAPWRSDGYTGKGEEAQQLTQPQVQLQVKLAAAAAPAPPVPPSSSSSASLPPQLQSRPDGMGRLDSGGDEFRAEPKRQLEAVSMPPVNEITVSSEEQSSSALARQNGDGIEGLGVGIGTVHESDLVASRAAPASRAPPVDANGSMAGASTAARYEPLTHNSRTAPCLDDKSEEFLDAYTRSTVPPVGGGQSAAVSSSRVELPGRPPVLGDSNNLEAAGGAYHRIRTPASSASGMKSAHPVDAVDSSDHKPRGAPTVAAAEGKPSSREHTADTHQRSGQKKRADEFWQKREEKKKKDKSPWWAESYAN